MQPAAIAVPPDPVLIAVLPGCDFADAYSVPVARQPVDARRAAALAFTDALPDWATALMGLRNAVVGRMGLKTGGARRGFPVLRESADEVVLGLDDRHLDFRVLLRAEAAGETQSQITLTTAVRTHNALGRVYLAVITPFHKLIIRSLLRRLAQQLAQA